MANKTQLLITSLLKTNSKVFFDRPDALTNKDIQNELELRAKTDQMLSRSRMKLLDQLFPTRPQSTD